MSAICLVTIVLWQRVQTGSFARGSGFVAPSYFATMMIVGAPVSLVLLGIGGFIDAIRLSKAKKENAQTP